MSIAALLARGRAAWLAMSTDTCRITRAALPADDEFVAQVMDPVTKQYPTQARITIYEGPCRVQVRADFDVAEKTAGDRAWTYLILQLQLPALPPASHPSYVSGEPADVDVDHICDLLTSSESPALAGSRFSIAGPFHKSQAVYLRFRVKEPVG